MKILFVDTETTGLCPQSAALLEIAAIMFDFKTKEHKRFHCLLQFQGTMPDEAFFEKFPKHKALIKACMGDEALDRTKAWREWEKFLQEVAPTIVNGTTTQYTKITYGGKNPQFDLEFLNANGFDLGRYAHRLFDVGSYCADPFANAECLPTLQECLDQYIVDRREVQHDAMQDCIDCIDVVLAKNGIAPSIGKLKVANAVGGVLEAIKKDIDLLASDGTPVAR